MQNYQVIRKRKVVVVVGPTASGKTGIGVKLAKEFDGEIISADSRQVYRGLDIGTGKDLSELEGVKYHLIDIIDTGEKMTLFDYLPLARAAIEDILSRGKLPIIVGGTGLYIQGIVEGFELEKNEVKSKKEMKIYAREQLCDLTAEQLSAILQKIDPEKYEAIDHKNQHRLIRAIELAQEGLRPVKVKPDFEVLEIGLDIPRNELHERIDRRVDERFKTGMLEEVVGLLNAGVSPEWLLGLGLEYRDITNYVIESGIWNLESGLNKKLLDSEFKILNSGFQTMVQRLKYRIHQFARRQMTWFRRFPEINWLSDYDEMKRFVKIFLEH